MPNASVSIPHCGPWWAAAPRKPSRFQQRDGPLRDREGIRTGERVKDIDIKAWTPPKEKKWFTPSARPCNSRNGLLRATLRWCARAPLRRNDAATLIWAR